MFINRWDTFRQYNIYIQCSLPIYLVFTINNKSVCDIVIWSHNIVCYKFVSWTVMCKIKIKTLSNHIIKCLLTHNSLIKERHQNM